MIIWMILQIANPGTKDSFARQGWQSNKTRLEKNRFLLPGFFGFFQMDFEKTRVF